MAGHTDEQEKEFVQLLVTHQPVIRAFVISLLPGVSETDDVIQNTNEVLWTKRESFELGTNFKAWALTTARFQVMALQQKLKNENRAPLDEDVLKLIADQSEQKEPDEINQKLNDLNECISQLNAQDQELVLHRYWEKSNLEQYADATGRSINAVKVALFRVRKNLRDCLERKDRIRRSSL